MLSVLVDALVRKQATSKTSQNSLRDFLLHWLYIYTCAYAYIYIYTYICVSLSLSLFIYIYIYIHIHTHTYMYTYIYIYTHKNTRSLEGATLRGAQPSLTKFGRAKVLGFNNSGERRFSGLIIRESEGFKV